MCKPHKHQRAKDKKKSEKINVQRKLQEEE